MIHKIYSTFNFLVLAALLLISCGKNSNQKPIKYIAYVGRYSDKNATNQPENKFDQMHEFTLKKYINEFNEKEYSVKLELKTFDCKRDSAESAKVYEDISKNKDILGVIDNSWGIHLSGARTIIKDKNIPVIAINSDHNFAEFGPQVIFTGNNDYVPNEISIFTQKILNKKDIIFISEDDYSVHKSFLSTFAKSGMNLKKMFTIKNAASDKELAFDSLALKIDQAFETDNNLKNNWIVVNLHNEYGLKLLNHIDKKYKNIKLIGHAYIIPTIGNFKFGKNSGNQLILINNPSDAITRKIAIDLHNFKISNPDIYTKSLSPLFPKRCFDAITIFENYFIANKNKIPNSDDISNYFAGLKNSTQKSYNDLYYFNEKNELVPDLFYVQYKDGRLYSYKEQLNKKGAVIPNLIAGMEIIDLYNLDVSTNTFQADFYYWIKADSMNYDAEKYILFPNMKESGSAKSLVLEKNENGMIYKLYKVSGLFHQDYDLKDYPFDQQEINISMEVMNPAEKLKIAFDQSAFQQDTSFLEKFKVRGWEKEKYLLTVDNRISSTMRGDPDSNEDELKKFQVFSFRLFVKRTLTGPFLEIIMPLMLIGFVAISLLFIKDLSFGNIGEVSAGTFLGIITFSIAMASLSPSTDSITRSDILFWLTFAVVLICFLTIIVCNSIYATGEQIRQLKFIKRLRIFLIIGYSVASILILSN